MGQPPCSVLTLAPRGGRAHGARPWAGEAGTLRAAARRQSNTARCEVWIRARLQHQEEPREHKTSLGARTAFLGTRRKPRRALRSGAPWQTHVSGWKNTVSQRKASRWQNICSLREKQRATSYISTFLSLRFQSARTSPRERGPAGRMGRERATNGRGTQGQDSVPLQGTSCPALTAICPPAPEAHRENRAGCGWPARCPARAPAWATAPAGGGSAVCPAACTRPVTRSPASGGLFAPHVMTVCLARRSVCGRGGPRVSRPPLRRAGRAAARAAGSEWRRRASPPGRGAREAG